MTRTLRVAVVGCGKIGWTHARAVASLPDATLVGACDNTLSDAQAVADIAPGAMAYDSLAEMLATAELDALLVATDHKRHFEPAMLAIQAGVAPLVEKPLTTSLRQARELVDAAESAGVHLGAIFQRRFYPAAQRMHDAVVQGRVGRVVAAECLAHLGRDRAYYEGDSWRGSWSGEGGGVLLTMSIHLIDLMNWMLGQPRQVFGRWATLKHGEYIDVEDVAGAVVIYDSGAIATIQAMTTFENGFASQPSTTTGHRAPGFRLAVHGAAGHSVGLVESPEVSQAVTDLWTFDDEQSSVQAWSDSESGRPGLPDFHGLQIAEFLDAIRADRPPSITGLDALRALEVVQGIYLSQARQQPVNLPMNPADQDAADALVEAAS